MLLCSLCAKVDPAMIVGIDKENELDPWFPECYRVSKERMRSKVQGQLHALKAVEVTHSSNEP